MLVAPGAEFLEFHAVRLQPLVLLRRVVPLLALRASEDDDITHDCGSYF